MLSPLEMGLHFISEALLQQGHHGVSFTGPPVCWGAKGQLPMNHINDPVKCTPEHPGDVIITHFIIRGLLKNVL